jgi:hypothetical protein
MSAVSRTNRPTSPLLLQQVIEGEDYQGNSYRFIVERTLKEQHTSCVYEGILRSSQRGSSRVILKVQEVYQGEKEERAYGLLQGVKNVVRCLEHLKIQLPLIALSLKNSLAILKKRSENREYFPQENLHL